MRRVLATLAIAGLATVAPTTAQAAEYTRDCGGMVDMECRGRVCPSDCWEYDCVVWLDLLHNSMTAQCVQPR